MNIFIAHSSSYDFKDELYLPLRNSQLNKEHQIKLPQENGPEVITKDVIQNSDVVVAEVSYASTGQGIELGWADIFDVPIICIYKKGSKFSHSVQKLTDIFIEYEDSEDMIAKLTEQLQKIARK